MDHIPLHFTIPWCTLLALLEKGCCQSPCQGLKPWQHLNSSQSVFLWKPKCAQRTGYPVRLNSCNELFLFFRFIAEACSDLRECPVKFKAENTPQQKQLMAGSANQKQRNGLHLATWFLPELVKRMISISLFWKFV